MVEVVTVEIDTPPEKRWTKILKERRGAIHKLHYLVLNKIGKTFLHLTDTLLMKLLKTFSKNDVREIEGIAETVGLNVGEVVLFNVFLELTTLCTSVVIRHPETGEMIHARNLDFGLGFGMNKKSHKLKLQEILQELVFDVVWKKNGKVVARTTNFAGYLGVLTGFNTNGYTYSMNQRFSLVPSIVYLLENLAHRQRSYVGILARDLLLSNSSYEQALYQLQTKKLVSPAYFTISSNKQAALIARGVNKVHEFFTITPTSSNWNLFITNYDKKYIVPPFDQRRYQIKRCMNDANLDELKTTTELEQFVFDLLSTKPVINKQTVYTTIMSHNHKTYKTYIRDCPDPCPIF